MRISVSKVAIVAILALIPTLGGMSAASAGSEGEAAVRLSCPSDGYITRGDRCTTLSNGVLQIGLGNGGSYVDVQYDKNSGGAISAQLGYLRAGSTHYTATETITTSVIANSSWSGLANPCYPTNGLLYSGGTTYQTPAAISSSC
ncbi:hypothetical protein [Streptomyces sp. NPDC056244]|uniref:hypothetical protein n=1 Tax=Streptomyces sp. NPDC056244 TaxID=3345762 RepID=UPI0035DE4123